MGVSKRLAFDLQMHGESIRVLVNWVRMGEYVVRFGNGTKIGSMCRNTVERGFVCTDDQSGSEHVGITREQAATVMVYACYPEGTA